MKCQAQTPDKTPCQNTAESTAIVDGRMLWVCAFHHAAVRASIRQRPQVTGLGAWIPADELEGRVIVRKKGRR